MAAGSVVVAFVVVAFVVVVVAAAFSTCLHAVAVGSGSVEPLRAARAFQRLAIGLPCLLCLCYFVTKEK